MVTPDGTENAELSNLIRQGNTKRWDLTDMSKKEPWLLEVEAKLRTDADVYAAVTVDRKLTKIDKFGGDAGGSGAGWRPYAGPGSSLI